MTSVFIYHTYVAVDAIHYVVLKKNSRTFRPNEMARFQIASINQSNGSCVFFSCGTNIMSQLSESCEKFIDCLDHKLLKHKTKMTDDYNQRRENPTPYYL